MNRWRRTGMGILWICFILFLPTLAQPSPPGSSTEEADHRVPHAEEGSGDHDHEQGHDHEEHGGAPGWVPTEEAREIGVPLVVEPVNKRPLGEGLQVPGEVRVDPKRLAHLTARVQGWIGEVYSVEEDPVQEGQILATLESPEYLAAQTEYLLSLRRVRQAQTPSDQATAQALLSSALDRLLLLGAWMEDISQVAEQGKPLRSLPIRSPLQGVVLERHVIPGKSVAPGDLLYRIADLSEVWVMLQVPESSLGTIALGDRVILRAPTLPPEGIEGHIERISSTIQEETRTVPIRVVVANPGNLLRPGMFVEGSVSKGSSQGPPVLAVPQQAVVLFNGEKTVFVAEDEGYRPVSVRTGRMVEGWVEILEGISPGTRVVTQGAYDLKAFLMKGMLGEGHVH